MRVLDGKEFLYVIEPEDLDNVPETVTMDCELVTQWVDWEYEAYDAIRKRHASCPRYVPAREEFLRYEDEYYYEETPAKQKMRKFLAERCGLQGEKLDDCLLDILCSLHVDTELDAESILNGVTGCFCFNEEISRQICVYEDEFLDCLGELYEHMRFVYTNAYTLAELRKMQTVADIEVESPVDFLEYTLTLANKSKRKIGRNDPCPCGSGKKFKKCCGRGK